MGLSKHVLRRLLVECFNWFVNGCNILNIFEVNLKFGHGDLDLISRPSRTMWVEQYLAVSRLELQAV